MNDPTIKLVRTADDWEELTEAVRAAPKIGLDIETTPVPWYTPEFRLLTIALAPSPEIAYVIPFYHSQVSPIEADQNIDWLRDLVADFDRLYVMQNGAFDYVALASVNINLPLPWFDTMVAQYLLDVEKSKGLTDLAARYLGVQPWKDIDYKKPEEEDLSVLARLNGRDAAITLALYDPLYTALTDAGQMELYDRLMMPAVETLCRMEMSGIPVDRDRLIDLHAEIEDEIDNLLEDIREIAGEPKLNPNSTKQLGKLLYEKFELPVFVWTDGGAPSTNKEALHKLEGMHSIIPKLLKFRELRKLFTASLTPWLDKLDDMDFLHPRYKPAHVKTGRLASEMPNIQQVPRDPRVRRVFGGREDHMIVEMDYSQLELRIVAWLASEEEMLRAFRAGEDLHQVTADAFGVDRQTAKALNFGLLYGAGPKKLKWIAAEQYGVELSMMQAESLRAQWFKKYPQIEKYHKSAVLEAQLTGGVTTALGRWRPIPDINSEDWGKKAHAERQAINTPVQSLASDLTLIKLNEIAEQGFYGVIPIATVHDSILFEFNTLALHLRGPVRDIMEDTTILDDLFGLTCDVPLNVDIKTGTHWGE